MKNKLTIGTRQSALALWQTNWVVQRLAQIAPELQVDIQKITTQGDRRLDVSLSRIGGKGLFTAELEEALLSGKIDLAVHSLKDMPTLITPGLTIAAVSPREDARDALVSRERLTLDELPQGARIGTSSLRRAAQLRHLRQDLHILDLRGNVDTRLRKLQQGNDYDAIVLAAAGLHRLGLQEQIAQSLDFSLCLPAAGQGVMAIEGRAGDEISTYLRDVLNDIAVETAIRAERAFLDTLQGGCQVPIGAYATVEGDICRLQGMIVSLEGTQLVRHTLEGRADKPEELGQQLAAYLLDNGGRSILEKVRAE